MAGIWDGERLELVEMHRFGTSSLQLRGRWHWDILYLYSEILTGLRLAVEAYDEDVVSVAVDTWGVDYGLLDASGELLSNPVCYRDSRTDGIPELVAGALTRELVYEETGVQPMFFNTLFQLAAEVKERRASFLAAKRILFLPDLLNFWLCGVPATERSIASTSQMLNPLTKDWSSPVMKYLGLSPELFGEVIEPGQRLGPVTPEVATAVGCSKVEVVAAAGHDTASAFMALPQTRSDFAVLSSGTWSIMGLELEEPNCSAAAREADFSNEIGYGGTVLFIKNICGFWLLEECRRQWLRDGREISYDELVSGAELATPMRSLIDPDDPAFSKPGDMPAKIRQYCCDRGELEPETPTQLARCIYDSLALRYATVFEDLSRVSGQRLNGLFVLGGGTRNALLNQLTADVLGLPVVCGASEASAVGNVMAQMIAEGEAENLSDARTKVADSFPPKSFLPRIDSDLLKARERFEALLAARV
ncbi:FGGY family of carbohydrate kinase, N-terminal domain protein [Verrucomicrobiia bacterium DG1235]|nr:FGGY family of carbohydrate kinase, N-terminal domain protein [Verrucomicrobiae bacterium DG1235]